VRVRQGRYLKRISADTRAQKAGVAPMTVDWPALRSAAIAAAANAYAPYSRLRVGAAGLTANGTIVTGCNVENASFGLTLCAECGLVSALHSVGGARLIAVSVVAGDGAPIVPCGRCRQLLLEAGGAGLLLDSQSGPRQLGTLLPEAFTGTDLAERRDLRS
jgi:cytidine deaminase